MQTSGALKSDCCLGKPELSRRSIKPLHFQQERFWPVQNGSTSLVPAPPMPAPTRGFCTRPGTHALLQDVMSRHLSQEQHPRPCSVAAETDLQRRKCLAADTEHR